MGEKKQLIIIGGDSGVYVGMAAGGVRAVDEHGRVVLENARHLRRYYVAGRTGDGSISDLAVKGLDPESPSVSDPVPGETILLGVRRAVTVSVDVAASFGVPA